MNEPAHVRIVPIIIATFIPWLILLAGEGAAVGLGDPLYLFVQYTLAIAIFAISFSMYYRANPHTDPFEVTISAMACIFIYEIINWGFISQPDPSLFTYLHWIVPMFLIATTIYALGRHAK